VQNVIGNTPDELHQAEDELSPWSVVENEFRSILRGVTLANLIRRHRLGRVVLQAYHVSMQLVREEAHAELLPHAEAMSRINRFGRRRAKPPAKVDPQQPTKPKKLDAARILRQLAEIRRSIPFLMRNPMRPVFRRPSAGPHRRGIRVPRSRRGCGDGAAGLLHGRGVLARSAHTDLIQHVQRMREAYERDFGRPIPPRAN